jgi:predicted nucleic acid-binding protein
MWANSGIRVPALSTATATLFLLKKQTGEQNSSKLRSLPDSLAVRNEWRRLLVEHGVSGVQVHDARLTAAMRVHGVKRILTFNDRDFARYTDIEPIHPRTVPTK